MNRDNTKLVAALGLQPGEAYEQSEECHTHETTSTFCGRKIEIYFDEMAGPFSQWNAFCLGIGTKSGLERADVIARIKTAIRPELKHLICRHRSAGQACFDRWEKFTETRKTLHA